MDKRYQVFVSSTYADLKEERRNVIQALMEMDCIPSGMEIFPAADEEQWEFIKKVINDCDYYLLIIGGRYGSVTPEGISYTEKEYDYAVSKGLRVIAFIHGNPEEIPAKHTELDPELREKLEAFRQRVSEGRLVKLWTKAEELPGLVALSLSKTIKTYPAIGWVRADQAGNPELLKEVHELRKRNQELEKVVVKAEARSDLEPVKNLAELDEQIVIHGTDVIARTQSNWNHSITWSELFAAIAPYLLQIPTDDYVKTALRNSVYSKTGRGGSSVSLNDQVFQTVKVQMMALGLVEVTFRGIGLFWTLTEKGREQLMHLRTVKSKKTT